ncbi:MAG TPA: MltA domain-containing protein [Planctomycetota bacterium]|nr:MltA domain-containing protein [Planctomycetota bacterium]
MRLPRLLLLALLAACKSKAPPPEPPDFDRQLGAGEHALRKVTDPSRVPIGPAYEARDERLSTALERSERWFLKPSTVQWFPIEGITHEQAEASVREMRRLLDRGLPPPEFVAEFLRLFDVYESVGYDGKGTVYYTGYHSPVFKGSRTRTDTYGSPLYARPKDLVTDEKTGEPLGRKGADGSVEGPYPTREEIESKGMLEGTELVWLESPLAAFIIHVNGSGKIELDDGSVMYVGYHGKNGREYKSLGQMMVDAGMMRPEERGLAAIRRVYAQQPAAVEALMRRNDSFVFFREANEAEWPAGSLGFPVTEMTTLATDKQTFPRGGLVLVETHGLARGGVRGDIVRFMADQDTGGAIRAPGRADIFMGIGPDAEALAGEQRSLGHLYYFFLKQEHLPPPAEPSTP